MNGSPEAAWTLYLQLSSKHAQEAVALARLVADECYGMGHFLYAAKAFQVCAFVAQMRRSDVARLRHTGGNQAQMLHAWMGTLYTHSALDCED